MHRTRHRLPGNHRLTCDRDRTGGSQGVWVRSPATEPVIIPTLTIQPDERDAPTVDGQDEPAPEPVGPDVTAVEPADVPEEKTDDAQAEEKPKPGKTSRRGKAGADDEAWLAWIDELTAKGENPTASKAVDAGLAASGSTAKRYLARIRREHSERF